MRVFLVRHGQPQQHAEGIFLGQTDVPLSQAGRGEAAAAAEELLRLGARARRIYTSDLSRARETAEILARRLERDPAGGGGGVTVIGDKLFREMDMGSWDGEFISEIKRKFPEEYEKRGDDIKNYRVPGGENFYDLKGRVTREFYRVWRDEFAPSGAPDLVIVSHLGVMRTILCELWQDEDEAFGRRCPTGSVIAVEAPDWLV